MTSENRPLPEAFLKMASEEEKSKTKGRLKIFLGMAAGVGKTYAMLSDAGQQARDGIDVVVGIAETHGRKETEKLLEGLKVLPKKPVRYRDALFHELDLDAIIALHPTIAVVDELAHTNVPGLRHAKRWQDVMELLDHGIDVYTTLNVQHIESLKEVVEGITEIAVRETVPDMVIETSTFIQVVDLTPDELLQRLKEGKVYLGEQSTRAAAHFFQKDRLTALREIVMRFAAEKIDRDLHIMVTSKEGALGWKAKEKLMVAVSSDPHAQKVIRTTRRLAFRLGAPWIAVNVLTGETLDEAESNRLQKNLELARELGAEVLTTNDPDIAQGLLRAARQNRVTQIVMGRSERLLTRLLSISKIDIYVVETRDPGERKRRLWLRKFRPGNYLFISLLVCLLGVGSWMLSPWLSYKVAGVIFLTFLLISSLFFRSGPIIWASFLSAFIWNVFFIPPLGVAKVESNEDMAILLLYFVIAISTGILVDRARRRKMMMSKREETAQALYGIIKQIATSTTLLELSSSIKERLEALFPGTFELFEAHVDHRLNIDESSPLLDNEKERATATWVFENGKEAGWSTDTLPSMANLYMPLKSFNDVMGLLVYRPKGNRLLTFEEKNFLQTVCQQLGGYLHRYLIDARQKESERMREMEEVHRTVLERISLELNSPVQAIQSAIKQLTGEAVPGLIFHTIQASSESLGKMVSNITVMAKLSEGLIPLKKEPHSMSDLIVETCKLLKPTAKNHQLKIIIEEGLPLVVFDYQLMQVLLQNLLRNAVDYSPEGTVVEIEARVIEPYLLVSIADEGPGIPEDRLHSIFEKFYRLDHPSSAPGVGLGLAIAKTIAEIHQGHLKAENRLTGGAQFTLYLPL